MSGQMATYELDCARERFPICFRKRGMGKKS